VSTSAVLPSDLRDRIVVLRDRTRSCAEAVAAHARDVMHDGADPDTLTHIQSVHGRVLSAVSELEAALREAGS
jgi:hypothetical protein